MNDQGHQNFFKGFPLNDPSSGIPATSSKTWKIPFHNFSRSKKNKEVIYIKKYYLKHWMMSMKVCTTPEAQL